MKEIKNILILAALCALVRPDVIVTPENIALRRGASAELKCGANSGSSVSSWTFTAYQNSMKDVAIYNRNIRIVSNITSFRRITDKGGFLNIKADSIQQPDAGIYTCNILLQESTGRKIVQHSAHLIVIDSDPNCTAIDHSTNGLKFKQLTCSVGCRGFWAPVMEWRKGGSSGTIVTNGVQSNTSSTFVSQSLTIPVDNKEYSTISYTCVTFFSKYMGNVSATANNIPNYNFTWSDSVPTAPANLNSDTQKLHLIELTGVLAAVVGVLVLLLLFTSARNCKKYNRDSALVKEEYPINVEHLETHNKSSSSSAIGVKKSLNKVVEGKRSFSYFGADGTEYSEISSGQNYRPQMPIRNPTRYEQVVYASIDHTLKAPQRYV